MSEETAFVKLTLEDSYGLKSTMEYSDSNDPCANDIVNMFYGAMIGLTFQESTILDAMLEFVADRRNTQYVDINNPQDNPDYRLDNNTSISSQPHLDDNINISYYTNRDRFE